MQAATGLALCGSCARTRVKWNTDLLAQFVACASLLKYLPMYSLDTTSADMWACRIMRRFRFRGRLVAGAPMLLCRWNS